MESALTKRENITADLRLKTAMTKPLPSIQLPKDKEQNKLVSVFRDEYSKWEGPYVLSKVEGKTTCVLDANNREKPFSITV